MPASAWPELTPLCCAGGRHRARPARAVRRRSAALLAGATGAAIAAGLLAPPAVATSGVPSSTTLGPQNQVRVQGTAYFVLGWVHAAGHPVGGDEVTILRDTGHGMQRLATVPTASDGHFSYRGTTPGSIVLYALSGQHGAVEPSRSSWAIVHATRPASPPLGARAVALASRLAGDPYVYGAEGPRAFDCSGLTAYVYGSLGHPLPHSAQAQYDDVAHIAQSAAEPGDLVFFGSPGDIYHVGIYAGDGAIWHAPVPGQTVRREPIWTSAFEVGRVR